MDEEATIRMQVRESNTCDACLLAVIAALAFSAFIRAGACAPSLFPGPPRLRTAGLQPRRPGNELQVIRAHLKTQHVNSISGGALLHKLGILGGRLLLTHTPFLLLHYDNHDPWTAHGSADRSHAYGRSSIQYRAVGSPQFVFTYVQLAGEDENGPPRWLRTEDADMCVRLLKSGTVTHLEGLPHVSVHLCKSRTICEAAQFWLHSGEDGRVRPLPKRTVALCLLLGYIAARYLV